MKDFKVINDRPSIVIVNTPAIDVNRLEGEFYKYDYLNAIDKIKKIRFLPLENLVDDIKDGPGGWDINISDYVEQGVPMLRTINIVDGLVNLDECVFIDIEKHKQLKRSRVVKNDVLLSVRGTIGKSAVYSKNFEANINAALVKITLKDNIIDPYFLVAFFNCKYGRLQTERIANGAVQLNMNLTEAKSNLIPIPSPEIQKYIGDKVRKAEELREEAKRLKKEAEGIIYKELNFGSLEDKLKIINNKYTWVGLHNLGIRIDSKYYNEKVLRIKDYFNKHYETIKLKECLQYCSRGKSFAESSEDGIILIKTKNLNNSFINYERNFVYEKEVNNNLILKEKDLIFASMGVGSLGKIDMYYPSEEKATIDGTLMLLRFKSDSKLKPEYVMEFLRTHIGQKLIYQNVVGSTGIISISVDDLINIDIPYIDDEKQEKISNFTNKYLTDIYASKRLIQEAKQDVEDLIEGNFDMSKVKANS